MNIAFKKVTEQRESNNDSDYRPSLPGHDNRGSGKIPQAEKKSQHPFFT
jgi:hypothetical protein